MDEFKILLLIPMKNYESSVHSLVKEFHQRNSQERHHIDESELKDRLIRSVLMRYPSKDIKELHALVDRYWTKICLPYQGKVGKSQGIPSDIVQLRKAQRKAMRRRTKASSS